MSVEDRVVWLSFQWERWTERQTHRPTGRWTDGGMQTADRTTEGYTLQTSRPTHRRTDGSIPPSTSSHVLPLTPSHLTPPCPQRCCLSPRPPSPLVWQLVRTIPHLSVHPLYLLAMGTSLTIYIFYIFLSFFSWAIILHLPFCHICGVTSGW